MTGNSDRDDNRLIRRTRQACTNCRRKKVRCSGQRPACSLCRHLSQECQYSTESYTTMVQSSQDLLSSRVASLESQLAQITNTLLSQSQRPLFLHPEASPRGQEHFMYPLSDSLNLELPPEMVQSAIDDYFTRCQNQPCSLFQEQRFRGHLEMGLVPRYLVLVFLACSIRSSPNLVLQTRQSEIVDSYRRESWTMMVTRWQEANEETDISILQALTLHCILDLAGKFPSRYRYFDGYKLTKADGNNYRAWIKIGLAVRICQDLRLMLEPSPDLDPVDQEERRRIFWTIYVCDKFTSCERTRPSAIAEDDCHVQLPSDEESFHQGLYKKTSHIDLIRSTDLGISPNISQFGLLVMLSSALGRCAKYNLHERNYKIEKVPWDSTSDFATINSFLYLVESNFPMEESLSTLITREYTANGVVDQQRSGHLILSRVVFYLCRLLLHHPLLLRRRANEVLNRAPKSFFRSALQSCREYAIALVTAIQDALDTGCLVSNPFYAYCAFMAGTMHCLHLNSSVEAVRTESLQYLESTRVFLCNLSNQWKTGGSMLKTLQIFQTKSSRHSALILSPCTIENGDADNTDQLVQLMDYGLSGICDVYESIPEDEIVRPPFWDWAQRPSDLHDLSESPLANPSGGKITSVQHGSDVAHNPADLVSGESIVLNDSQDVSPLSHFLLSQNNL